MYSLAVRPSSVSSLHGGPEDVAGRVVGQAQVFLQPLALGALARPGRSEKYEIELSHGDQIVPRPTGVKTPSGMPKRIYLRKPS